MVSEVQSSLGNGYGNGNGYGSGDGNGDGNGNGSDYGYTLLCTGPDYADVESTVLGAVFPAMVAGAHH